MTPRWSGQLFPLVLLALLAGLSFWLQQAIDLPPPKRDGKLRHDPDTLVDNFVIRRLNSAGQLQYELKAPHMRHFADDDSSLIQEPDFTYLRPNAPNLGLRGKQAEVRDKGDTVLLHEDVVITRAASPGGAALEARTSVLTVKPEQGIAFTDAPVDITQGGSWLKGTGMHIDNNTSTVTLQSRVTGLLYSSKRQP